MKKRILALLMCAVIGLGTTSAVFADEVDDRIAEIEAQIATLQEELNGLKTQKLEASGDGYVPSSEYQNLFTDADQYKDKAIKIAGRMYGAMEQDEDAKYFQMFYPLNGDNKLVMVRCDLSSPDFVSDDYIMVTGTVLGAARGTNAFGGEVRAVAIEAVAAEKTDYATAMNPAIKTADINLQIDQFGYIIEIQKIEFSTTETRLYAKFINNGGATFYCYPYSTKIVQGNSQYEYQMNYDADYPELQSELLPGTLSEGIICFPKMDENAPLTIYFEGYSDNYDEDVQMYQFNIQ